jgi:hypothetical protein
MKILSLALAAVLATGLGSAYPVLAQSVDDDSFEARRGERDRDDGDRDRGRGHRGDRDGRDRDGGWRHHGWNHHGPGYGRMGRMGWRSRSGESGGASFRFRRGDARIDIRCPADESLKTCVDAAGMLIDRIGKMGAASGPATTDPSAVPDGTDRPPPGLPGSPGGRGMDMPGGTAPGGGTAPTAPDDRT